MHSFNVFPYFDDFDSSKNYHQILFRPGFPVQARELTQLQTILQEQIKRFGDHVFVNGSMVIPGNVHHDLKVYAYRMNTIDSAYDYKSLEGKVLKGETSKVRSHVLKATKANTGEVTVFLKTVSNGEDDPSLVRFQAEERILLENVNLTHTAIAIGIAGIAATDASIGFVNDGVYFVNGKFVAVQKQSVVLSDTSSVPSCKVGLTLDETVISDSDDPSLLDPALGYSNENGPGAHRYKVELILTKYDTGQETDDSFIPLFELENGELIFLIKSSTYSELLKTLARRTYEESGNYISRPYNFKIDVDPMSSANVIAAVTRGISFVGGYEVDNTVNRLTTKIAKARSTANINNGLIRVNIGNYLLVGNRYGLPRTWSYIELRDDSYNPATPGTPAGKIIGFAKVRSVQPNDADTSRVYIFDAEFVSGKSINDVASYREFAPASGTIAVGNIVNTYVMSNTSGQFNLVDNISSSINNTRSVTPISYNGTTRVLYATKRRGAYTWVNVGELVSQSVSNITAVVTSSTIINEPTKAAPIVSIPKSVVKTVSDVVCIVNRQIEISINGSGDGSLNLPVGETIHDASLVSAWVSEKGSANEGNIVNVSLTTGSNAINIFGLPVTNTTITVSVPLRKSISSHKSKTVVTGTLSAITPRSKIALGKTHVFELVSVMSGATNVTSSYSLIQNNKDASYNQSYIELTAGAAVPTDPLEITFKYFANGSGDYYTVDSYTSLGTDDSFITKIPSYKTNSGNTFKLQDSIDFRPTTRDSSISSEATFTASNQTITLKAPGNGLLSVGSKVYGSGFNAPTDITSVSTDNEFAFDVSVAPSVSGDSIVIAGFDPTTYRSMSISQHEPILAVSDFSLDFEYYLPRIDTVCMTNKGTLEVFTGLSAETPSAPKVVEDDVRMKLFDAIIPAYTFSPKDIQLRLYSRKRYTMSDIGKIDSRISNIEEVTALNALEQDLASTQIVDPVTGLNRFKSGFVVDNFADHAVIDMSDESIAYIDYETRTLSVQYDTEALPLVFVTDPSVSTNFELSTDQNLVHLPIVEEVAIVDQPMATRDQNINPFAVFKWTGKMKMDPQSDFWTETSRLGDINIVVNRQS